MATSGPNGVQRWAVFIWEVGNEDWSRWRPQDYAEILFAFRNEMRRERPDIKLLAQGLGADFSTPYGATNKPGEWLGAPTKRLAEGRAVDSVHSYSIHKYLNSGLAGPCQRRNIHLGQRAHRRSGADRLAPDGVQTAFMHTGDVHMCREVRIEPGTYNISVHAARRRYGQENPNPIQVLVDGKEYGAPITPGSTRFQKYYSGNFTIATSAVYTVEIATRSRQATVGDTFFDKVELNPVTEQTDTAVLRNPFGEVGGKASSWGR